MIDRLSTVDMAGIVLWNRGARAAAGLVWSAIACYRLWPVTSTVQPWTCYRKPSVDLLTNVTDRRSWRNAAIKRRSVPFSK